MSIVVNSGPLMALGKLGLLELFSSFHAEVLLPSAVYTEVVVRGLARGYADASAAQLAIRRGRLRVIPVNPDELRAEIAALPLDAGEKQVLHLALKEQAELVLLDDLKARESAHALGLSVKGTLGVIVQAYRGEHISLDEVRSIIEAIIERDDIWIAEGLCRYVLESLSHERERAMSQNETAME